MKKLLLVTIPVLTLVIVVTTAHAWLATALCQHIGDENTASGNAGSYGLQNGHVTATADVNNYRKETKFFYQYSASASAYDDGPGSYTARATGWVWGWNPSLQRYSSMYREHSNGGN